MYIQNCQAVWKACSETRRLWRCQNHGADKVWRQKLSCVLECYGVSLSHLPTLQALHHSLSGDFCCPGVRRPLTTAPACCYRSATKPGSWVTSSLGHSSHVLDIDFFSICLNLRPHWDVWVPGLTIWKYHIPIFEWTFQLMSTDLYTVLISHHYR